MGSLRYDRGLVVALVGLACIVLVRLRPERVQGAASSAVPISGARNPERDEPEHHRSESSLASVPSHEARVTLVARPSARPAADARATDGGHALADAALEPQERGMLRGRLVDLQGRAPVGGWVRLERLESPLDRALRHLSPEFSPPSGRASDSSSSGFEPRTMPAGEGGAFRFDGLAGGAYRVRGHAPGYDRVVEDRTIVSQGDEGALLLHLGDGRVLDGAVTDERGAPIAGAAVHLGRASDVPALAELIASAELAGRVPEVRSDERGAFRIEGVRPGQALRLAVSAAGYVTLLRDADLDAPCLVRLVDACELRGSVTRAGGEPVGGARVRLEPAGGASGAIGAREEVTDELGAFTFEDLVRGSYLPSLSSWAGCWTGVRLLLDSGTVPLDIVLDEPLSLTVRVVDGSGAALARAEVRASLASDQAAEPARAVADHARLRRTTDATGQATFHGLSTALWQIEASAPGHAASEAFVMPSGTRSGGARELELVLARAATVSVAVVDARGVPVPRARVELRRADQVTFAAARTSDSRGQVTWSDLGPGPYVAVHDPAWIQRRLGEAARTPEAAAQVALEVPAGGVVNSVLELAREAFLTVTVGRAGVPLEGAMVMLVERSAFVELVFRAETRLGSIRTDPRGAAALSPVLPGAYSLCVRASGGGMLRTFDIDLAPGHQATRVELDHAWIRGVVLGEQTEPLVGATVRLVPLDFAGLGTGRFLFEGDGSGDPIQWAPGQVAISSGSEGGFEFVDVEPGPYQIEVEAPGYAAWLSSELEVGRQAALELDPIELRSACVVRGRMVGGEPDASREAGLVALRTEAGGHVDACVVDARGEFEFENVPRGRYRLVTSVGGLEVVGDPFDVALASVTVQDLALP